MPVKEHPMRYLTQIPLMAIVIAVFNALGLGGQWMDTESLFYDGVLPSQAEFYLKFGELLIVAGLFALFLDILKATRIATIGAGLAVIVFIVALVEFLAVPFCGTTTFFFLMLMALVEAAAAVMLLIARRP
jgi:hypothetical protein